MKKIVLILLVSVFFGFQLAEAQTTESSVNPVKTEVQTNADDAVKLHKTDAETASKKACCAEGDAKGCCSAKASAGKKNCSSAQKASCSHSKAKLSSKVARTEDEMKSSAQ